MKKLIILFLLAVVVSGCASKRDLTGNLSGTDKLEPSPCACMPVPYEIRNLEWVSHG